MLYKQLASHLLEKRRSLLEKRELIGKAEPFRTSSGIAGRRCSINISRSCWRRGVASKR
jgi:hypothetical protein